MTEKIFTKAEDDIVRDMGMDAVRDAAAADASEHSMTLRQAFNSHRKAIFWSMALSGALVSHSCILECRVDFPA